MASSVAGRLAEVSDGVKPVEVTSDKSTDTPRSAFVPTSGSGAKIETIDDLPPKPKATKRPTISETPTPPVSEPAGEMNMNLDSFEKVMEAMDAELAKAKAAKRSKPSDAPTQPAAGPTKAPVPSKSQRLPTLPTEADLDDFDDDDLLAMDRELKAALKSAGVNSDGDDDDGEDGERIAEVGELDEEGKREYRMMKDFLESYKSQGGGSGVVGNLFGRLGENRP